MNRGIKISDEVYLEAPFQLEGLTELKLVRQFDDHAFIWLKGTASEEEETNILSMNEETRIRLYLEKEEESTLLFCGIPMEISFTCGGSREVLMKLLGNSIRMDWDKKSRSFQRGEINWEEIAGDIVQQYDGDFLSRSDGGNPCDYPLIQDRETDWEFLKRIGRVCNKPVYTTCDDEVIRLYMGYGSQDTASLSMEDREISHQLGEHFKYLKKNKANEAAERICQVESLNYYKLGQTLSYQGREYCISKVEGALKQGRMFFHYRLNSTDCSVCEKKADTAKFRGRSFPGTVLDVEEDKVKLHLDIDQEQTTEDAHWYPWHRNDWFCMPEVGAQAFLLLPETGEEGAYAAAVGRTDGGTNPKTRKPDIKYLETESQKGWCMNKDSMSVFAVEDEIHITLSEADGILVESEADINLTAKRIKLSSPKISMKSREKIWLATRRNSIVMDDLIQMKG